MSDSIVSDTDDDQLYYTKIYLDNPKRVSRILFPLNCLVPLFSPSFSLPLPQEKYGIRLDHRSHIFQNLNGAEDEVELHVLSNDSYAINTLYNTRSAVYHGNGASKVNR